MTINRPAVATIVGVVVAFLVITPLVWLINSRDWGVFLMLLAPLVIYALIHAGRRLAEWAGVGLPPSGD